MDRLEQLNEKIKEFNQGIKKIATENDFVYISGTYLLDNNTEESVSNVYTTENAIENDIYKAVTDWVCGGVDILEENNGENGIDDLII